MSDKTTILAAIGPDQARIVVAAFEAANVAMTPTTPISHTVVDGEHRFEADGVRIYVPAGDAVAPKKRRKLH